MIDDLCVWQGGPNNAAAIIDLHHEGSGRKLNHTRLVGYLGALPSARLRAGDHAIEPHDGITDVSAPRI